MIPRVFISNCFNLTDSKYFIIFYTIYGFFLDAFCLSFSGICLYSPSLRTIIVSKISSYIL